MHKYSCCPTTDYISGYNIEYLVSLAMSAGDIVKTYPYNEAIKQRATTSPKIKYFPIEFDRDSIHVDIK